MNVAEPATPQAIPTLLLNGVNTAGCAGESSRFGVLGKTQARLHSSSSARIAWAAVARAQSCGSADTASASESRRDRLRARSRPSGVLGVVAVSVRPLAVTPSCAASWSCSRRSGCAASQAAGGSAGRPLCFLLFSSISPPASAYQARGRPSSGTPIILLAKRRERRLPQCSSSSCSDETVARCTSARKKVKRCATLHRPFCTVSCGAFCCSPSPAIDPSVS